MSTPGEVQAQAQVSAWLTHQQLGFTTIRFENARTWQVPFGGTELPNTLIPVLIYVAGSTLGVGIQVKSRDASAWYDEVWGLLEPKVPFVRVTPHRDENDIVQPDAFWIKVEVPLDTSSPTPVLPGTMLQAVAAVLSASNLLVQKFPDRFELIVASRANLPATKLPGT